jgi:predicted NBD/HSP70 family sugar kinase
MVVGPVIHLLNPDVLIVGGDVGNWGYDLIRPELMASLQRYTMRPALAEVTVIAPKLVDQATIQGTVALVLGSRGSNSEPLTTFLRSR